MLNIQAGFYLIRRVGYHIRWLFINSSWLFFKQNNAQHLVNKNYSIGIVTYFDRYGRFFKPLITRLVSLFPDTEIVIAINGYHNKQVQAKYLEQIGAFLAQFPNVKIVQFNEPQSLSKLWNLLMVNSLADKTFIFNDDIQIGPQFREDLNQSGIMDEEVALINESWSHYLISKNTVKKIGWFDERFPAVGNEDEDYECRLVLNGIYVKNFKIRSLKNIVFKTQNFSWKNTEVVNSKYVRANQVFFNSKWDVKEDAENGYTYVRILNKYVCLKAGMETPEFYTSPTTS
ncbi:MAG TPA: hypothetical protein VNI52_05920 [Sphingobacteriaceae bacterium]|nr:hypothetical protein [Sphingobacteriaceae bacterium]